MMRRRCGCKAIRDVVSTNQRREDFFSFCSTCKNELRPGC